MSYFVNTLKNLSKSALKIIKALGKDWVEKSTGKETVKEVCEAVDTIKLFMLSELPAISKLKEERDAMSNFKNYLSQTLESLNGKKLLIIIDELDRCKPLFAIRTLEIIKHLFDIPNIVFLLSVDIKQLSHSISTIYGQNMDSEGYLRRFTNYILKLPEPSKDDYIDYLLSERPLFNVSVSNNDNFVAQIKMLFNFEGLSLRDINCIYENFYLFFNSKFKEHMNPLFSLPYLALMIFKYKDIEIYNLLLNGKVTDTSREQKHILANNILNRRIDNRSNLYDFFRMTRSIEWYLKMVEYTHNISTGETNIPFLFHQDVELIIEMNDESLSPAQYIAKQIEMFTYRNEDYQR